MAKIADIAYKTTTGFLGLATILFGVNLMFNVSRGIAWHLENSSHTAVMTEPPLPSSEGSANGKD